MHFKNLGQPVILTELMKHAYTDEGEAAWPRSQALSLISIMTSNSIAVMGGEIWIPEVGGPIIPAPFIYTWTSPDYQPDLETWNAYVERANRDAQDYVETFAWDPQDVGFRDKEPYFTMTFLTQAG
ncbi:MAG: hypothetical protein ACREJC_08850, partial [Tepidisphaeraceae bacterium]